MIITFTRCGICVTLNSVRREIVSALTIVSYDKVRGRNKAVMTSFGLCKVFHYKYNTTGHNFTGHYYVLHMFIDLKAV